ncbi:MerR family transcriptional regulator, partial [Nocardia cyriacigeorgica]|uniref:MerR family transcriptional regulator n=1 Tax=Nocardia cyriacigeorgica TaxID=135487 RepID=UPI0032AE8203
MAAQGHPAVHRDARRRDHARSDVRHGRLRARPHLMRKAETMRTGVTIGQAAAFVGVTVKTVRHYHKLGLVAEPGRDSSGFRRYGSAELLRLVRVRTLAA